MQTQGGCMPAKLGHTSRADRRDLEPGRHEAREIFVHAGLVVVRARLLTTPAAELIWAALPIYSSIELPGGVVRADISVAAAARGLPKPQQDVSWAPAREELAIVRSASRVLICLGGSSRAPWPKAPASGRSFPDGSRLVFARAFDSVRPLLDLEKGRSIALLEAAS